MYHLYHNSVDEEYIIIVDHLKILQWTFTKTLPSVHPNTKLLCIGSSYGGHLLNSLSSVDIYHRQIQAGGTTGTCLPPLMGYDYRNYIHRLTCRVDRTIDYIIIINKSDLPGTSYVTNGFART